MYIYEDLLDPLNENITKESLSYSYLKQRLNQELEFLNFTGTYNYDQDKVRPKHISNILKILDKDKNLIYYLLQSPELLEIIKVYKVPIEKHLTELEKLLYL